MHLSTRQIRVYQLAILLSSGRPVSVGAIISELACSDPTLTRVLKELRESYSAEIKYSKATHTYQLISPGLLDRKTLRRMSTDLADHAATKPTTTARRVFLDKDKKKAVSLSLRMSLLRKIDQLSRLLDITRSEAVEMALAASVDELLRKAKTEKN